MSQANVERMERLVGAFNEGLDAWMACHAEEVVHTTVPDWPEGGTYQGRESVRRLWVEVLDTYPDYELTLDKATDAGGGRVLSKLSVWARGAASGADVTSPLYIVAAFDDEGLVSRIEYFLEHRQALEAVGLSE